MLFRSTALVDVLAKVSNGLLSPIAAKIAIKGSFPAFKDSEIEQMVDAAANFSPPPQQNGG